MRKIFLSYSREDAVAAQRVHSALSAIGVTGYLDAADLSAGSAVGSSIREALRLSSAVVVLLSPDALHSQWVQFELGASFAMGKPIVPVLVDEIPSGIDLPDLLRNLEWIDARQLGQAELASVLARALEKVTAQSG